MYINIMDKLFTDIYFLPFCNRQVSWGWNARLSSLFFSELWISGQTSCRSARLLWGGPLCLSPSVYTCQTSCLSFGGPSIRSVCVCTPTVCASACLHIPVCFWVPTYVLTHAQACDGEPASCQPQTLSERIVSSAFRLLNRSDTAAWATTIHTSSHALPRLLGHHEINVSFFMMRILVKEKKPSPGAWKMDERTSLIFKFY